MKKRALFLSLLLAGCASDPQPNPDIKSHGGTPPMQVATDQGVVRCEGPDAAIKALGPLCDFTGDVFWRGDVADMSLALGPDEGPYLVVLGFVPDRESTQDQAASIQYDVRLVRGARPQEDATAPLEQWPDGEPLSGEMSTLKAVRVGCDVGTFIAGGELKSGEVTLRISWNAGSGC